MPRHAGARELDGAVRPFPRFVLHAPGALLFSPRHARGFALFARRLLVGFAFGPSRGHLFCARRALGLHRAHRRGFFFGGGFADGPRLPGRHEQRHEREQRQRQHERPNRPGT
jgi:hypothetical protein